MPAERLQKILARAGFGGRRTVEPLISAGRVTVNGSVATLGMRADPEVDRIAVDGAPLRLQTLTSVVIALHKPVGYVVTAADEQGRPTVYDLIPDAPRGLRYVGRLDIGTSGLLLLTTDGELAHRLTHPRYDVEKVYEAVVEGDVSETVMARLRAGVDLDDGRTAPARVERLPWHGDGTLLRLVIHEGRNRQVRRMCEAVGHRVRRLRRTAVGPIHLGALPSGAARALTASEEHALRTQVGLAAGAR